MSRRLQRLRHIASIAAVMLGGTAVITGSSPVQAAPQVRSILVLLCRYADVPATFGITADRIQPLFTGPNSIDGLVREASLDTVSFEGSRAFGWFTLPSPKASYTDSIPDGQRLVTDCVSAARSGGVDPSSYTYALVYVNDALADAEGFSVGAGFGGRPSPTPLNSVVVNWKGLTSPGLVLHEIGHVLGGDHTGSAGDGLGGASWYGDNPASPFPGIPLRTNNVTPGWDAYNRDRMGFIPANRKVTASGGTQTIVLSRLTQPDATNPMIVDVPIAGASKYVVSARTQVGYDARKVADNNFMLADPGLPVAGVMIQLVGRPGGDGTTEVVMSKPGGDFRTADGVWLAGQTFTDAAAGITIRIDRFDATGAQITLTTRSTAVPATTATTTTVAPTTTAPPTTAPPTTVAPTTTAVATTTTIAAGTTVAPSTTVAITTTVAPSTTVAPATTVAPPPPPGTGADALASASPAGVPAQIATSNVGATLEANEQVICSGMAATVWFKVVADRDASLTVTTLGSAADTVLAVFSGPASGATVAGLQPLGCNDDADPSTGGSSAVTVAVTAGTTYYVQLGGYGNATGALTLNLSY